jgi:DNA-binding transcriptional LysR family regulator
MSGRTEWMIYGANGYSGHLVAAEARRRGLNPVVAGRRAGPIENLAAELGLPMRVFGLDDAPVAAAAIADIAVVANCAGPFAATSAPMIDACLRSRAHYLDITGEIEVFVADGAVLHEWALSGEGISWEALWDVSEDLASGRLVHVLREFESSPMELYAIFAPGKPVPPRIRLFVDHIAQAFARFRQSSSNTTGAQANSMMAQP